MTARIAADFVVRGATLITMDEERRVIANGAIGVKDDRIVWIGDDNACAATLDADNSIDAKGNVICPGFINAHVHTTGDPLTRHFSPDTIGGGEALEKWVLPRYIAHSPEDELLSAKFCALELMKAGTTTFVEAGTIRHLDEAVAGFRETGIRGRVGAWVEGRDYSGDAEAGARLIDEAVRTLEEEIRQYPDHKGERIAAWPILVGHNTNPDDVWRAAKSLADQHKLCVAAHMSPYDSDPAWYLEHCGARPLEHLEKLGVVGSNLLLTHMTHINEQEAAIVADNDVGIVFCPFATLKGAFGASKHGLYTQLLRNKVKITFATDGYDPEMLQAVRIGASLFKDLEADVATISAAQALERVTRLAAKAVGMDHEIGSLEVGKKADFVHFDTHNSQWRPLLEPVAQLVWSADSRSIVDVWIDGERVIKNGRHAKLDEIQLLSDVQVAAEKIIERANLPC